MKLTQVVTLAAVLTLLGCERAPFEPSNASLSTPAGEYELTDYPEYVEVVLPYRFVNETGRAVYVPRCNGELIIPRVEQLQDGEWVLGWEISYGCGAQGPAAIGPGEVIEGALRVQGMKADRYYPKFDVPEGGGTFRLVLPVYVRNYGLDSPRPEDRLPLEARSTEPFTIRPAPASERAGA
jgi:hypothetical protein